MVGAIFHAPRSSVAVPIALPYAGRANSHNDDERNFLKSPSPMDFRAASAARGFNWGFLLTRKDSNLQHRNQNPMCYHYTTGQLRGATHRLYSSPCRVCLLRSGARYGGSLRCCLGDNFVTGVRTYTF